jgi:hypothetical protein
MTEKMMMKEMGTKQQRGMKMMEWRWRRNEGGETKTKTKRAKKCTEMVGE